MNGCKQVPIVFAAALLAAIGTITTAFSAEPIDIGNRLELLFDSHLIAETEGNLRLRFTMKNVDLFSLRFD